MEENSIEKKVFHIKNWNETTKIIIEDISYMEKNLRLLNIYIYKGNKIKAYTIYGKIDDYMSRFDDSFYRIHHSCLVNLNKVSSMHDGEIYMDDGTVLLVGINSYRKARKRFNQFIETRR